jgi:hypothetical protein
MQKIFLLALLLIENSLAQSNITAIRSPWADPADPKWVVTKASDRITFVIYTIQQLATASLVYMDKLTTSNGTESYASLLSDQHFGIGEGFWAIDFEPTSLLRLTKRAPENRQRNIVPVSSTCKLLSCKHDKQSFDCPERLMIKFSGQYMRL